jgi:apolipoprotein N-acyltransferase
MSSNITVAGGPPSSELAPAEQPAEQHPSAWWLLACGLATSLLLYMAFLPVGWAVLGWIAFLPWLSLAATPGRPPRLYFLAWLGTLPWGFAVLSWVPVADWRMSFAWLVLGLYTSLHFLAAFYLVRLLRRRLHVPFTFGLPLVWVSLEYVRANLAGGFATLILGSYQHDFPGGFAWYLLGHTQHDFAHVIQIADLGGAFAVSFVLAAVNGLLYEAVLARWGQPQFSRLWLLGQGLIVGLLLAGTLGYGAWQLGRATRKEGKLPSVALLQGSMDQRIRNETIDKDEKVREEAFRAQMDLYQRLLGIAKFYSPDLIIWPETSCSVVWEEDSPGEPTRLSREVALSLTKLGSAHLLGANSMVAEDGKIRFYNSAILVRPGEQMYGGRYNKAHRVPFGEYIPFDHWLSFLQWLAPYPSGYGIAAGKQFTHFKQLGHTFGVLICFEDTDPNIARKYHDVDFLVNISNDGWFDGTSEHDEHLATARFRAVELRRPMVRVANMGISAVIDGNGNVLQPFQAAPGQAVWKVPAGQTETMPPAEWGRFKKMSCVIIAEVPLDTRESIYAQIGDAFSLALCGLLLLLLFVSRWGANK